MCWMFAIEIEHYIGSYSLEIHPFMLKKNTWDKIFYWKKYESSEDGGVLLNMMSTAILASIEHNFTTELSELIFELNLLSFLQWHWALSLEWTHLKALDVWVCLSSGKLKQLWSHTHLFKGDYFLTPRGSSSETTDGKSLFFLKKSLFPFKGSTIRQLLLFRCLVWFLVTISDRNVVKATEMTFTLNTLILLLQNSWASSEPPVHSGLLYCFTRGFLQVNSGIHCMIMSEVWVSVLYFSPGLMQQPRLHQTCSLVNVAITAWVTNTGLICLHLRVHFCGWDTLYSDAPSLASITNKRVKAKKLLAGETYRSPLILQLQVIFKNLFLYFGVGCWWSSRGNIMCSRVISSGYLSFTIFWFSVIISPMFCVTMSYAVELLVRLNMNLNMNLQKGQKGNLKQAEEILKHWWVDKRIADDCSIRTEKCIVTVGWLFPTSWFLLRSEPHRVKKNHSKLLIKQKYQYWLSTCAWKTFRL